MVQLRNNWLQDWTLTRTSSSVNDKNVYDPGRKQQFTAHLPRMHFSLLAIPSFLRWIYTWQKSLMSCYWDLRHRFWFITQHWISPIDSIIRTLNNCIICGWAKTGLSSSLWYARQWQGLSALLLGMRLFHMVTVKRETEAWWRSDSLVFTFTDC